MYHKTKLMMMHDAQHDVMASRCLNLDNQDVPKILVIKLNFIIQCCHTELDADLKFRSLILS